MPLVYKYLPKERADFLQTFKLRFTQPAALNDPFECLPTIKMSNLDTLLVAAASKNIGRLHIDIETAQRFVVTPEIAALGISEVLKNKSVHRAEVLGSSIETIRRIVNRDVGILSLAKSAAEPVMWAHYASNHSGLVIGFDSDHKFFQRGQTDRPDLGELRPVDYANERCEVDLNKIRIDISLMFRKSKSWEYEKEMRLVRELRPETYVRDVGGYPLHLFDVPGDSVQEIILGNHASTELLEAAQRAITDNPLLSSAVLKRAVPSESDFQMLFVDAV